MFYFLINSIIAYNWLLILSAVIPAVFLMYKVYVSDHLEKESTQLLLSLVKAGILSALLALVEENIGQWLLAKYVSPDDKLFNILMFFVVVAVSEESSKYIMMRKTTWNDQEFNCYYDGIVYAVVTSLGFALWENISYVLSYGLGTALVRAVTAIPGHASFGVFMGVFYGAAKGAEIRGDKGKYVLYNILSLAVPMLMHGAYDYIATSQTQEGSVIFLIFVACLFVLAFFTVNKASAADKYFKNERVFYDGAYRIVGNSDNSKNSSNNSSNNSENSGKNA